MLNPLANNSGPTLSLLPQAGSPVIDTGNTALVPPDILTDQRGYVRIVGGAVDIGSIEANSFPIYYSGKSTILTRNVITGEIALILAEHVVSNIHEV